MFGVVPGVCELDGEEVGGALRGGAPCAGAGAGHREHTVGREGLEAAVCGWVRTHPRDELLQLVKERFDALVRAGGAGRRTPFEGAFKVDPCAFVVAGVALVVLLWEERGPLPLLVLVPPEHPVLVLVSPNLTTTPGHALFGRHALGVFGGNARDVVLFFATVEEDGKLDVLGVHRGADIGL